MCVILVRAIHGYFEVSQSLLTHKGRRLKPGVVEQPGYQNGDCYGQRLSSSVGEVQTQVQNPGLLSSWTGIPAGRGKDTGTMQRHSGVEHGELENVGHICRLFVSACLALPPSGDSTKLLQ